MSILSVLLIVSVCKMGSNISIEISHNTECLFNEYFHCIQLCVLLLITPYVLARGSH